MVLTSKKIFHELDQWIMAKRQENCNTACDRFGLKCSKEEFEKHNNQVETCEGIKNLVEDINGSNWKTMKRINRCVAEHWAQSDIPVLAFDSGFAYETVAYISHKNKSKSTFDCEVIPHIQSNKKRRLCFCYG